MLLFSRAVKWTRRVLRRKPQKSETRGEGTALLKITAQPFFTGGSVKELDEPRRPPVHPRPLPESSVSFAASVRCGCRHLRSQSIRTGFRKDLIKNISSDPRPRLKKGRHSHYQKGELYKGTFSHTLFCAVKMRTIDVLYPPTSRKYTKQNE